MSPMQALARSSLSSTTCHTSRPAARQHITTSAHKAALPRSTTAAPHRVERRNPFQAVAPAAAAAVTAVALLLSPHAEASQYGTLVAVNPQAANTLEQLSDINQQLRAKAGTQQESITEAVQQYTDEIADQIKDAGSAAKTTAQGAADKTKATLKLAVDEGVGGKKPWWFTGLSGKAQEVSNSFKDAGSGGAGRGKVPGVQTPVGGQPSEQAIEGIKNQLGSVKTMLGNL